METTPKILRNFNRCLAPITLALTALVSLGAPGNAAPAPPQGVPAAPAPAPSQSDGTVGFKSFRYAGADQAATADKPQSKLWWNDGSWWAEMWTTGSGWHIYRLDRAKEKWLDTGALIDSRTNTLGDTLWDGTHLFVASHVVTLDTQTTTPRPLPNQPAQLYRYSYANGQYTLDAGFPVVIAANSSESLTIDQDSTGRLWATWTEISGSAVAGLSYTVYINHSEAGGTGWAKPSVLPAGNPHP
ncbi:MAG TPA: hypothetical protein VGE95_20900, partial [Arthrobacter sp.]